jgi:hypothetical protein
VLEHPVNEEVEATKVIRMDSPIEDWVADPLMGFDTVTGLGVEEDLFEHSNV